MRSLFVVALSSLVVGVGCSDPEAPWVTRPPGGHGSNGGGSGSSGGVDAAVGDSGSGIDAPFDGRVFGEVCLTSDLRAGIEGCVHPAATAPVTVTPRCASCTAATTTSIGTFAVDVPALPVDLRFTRADVVPTIDRAVSGDMPPTPVPSLTVRDEVYDALGWVPGDGGAILVHVVDATGARVEGASLTGSGADVAYDTTDTAPPWARTSATGPRGGMLIGNLVAGTTTVTVTPPGGGAAVSADVRVEADALSYLIVRVP